MSSENIDLKFTEVDNLVSLLSKEQTLRQIREMKQMRSDIESWEIENFINHIHIEDQKTDRETVQECNSFAQTLSALLAQAFYDRSFVISIVYIFGTVSFFQVKDVSSLGMTNTFTMRDLSCCPKCGTRSEILPEDDFDIDIPEAKFGHCPKCNAEILVECKEKRIFLDL